jgi:hypothetical protein
VGQPVVALWLAPHSGAQPEASTDTSAPLTRHYEDSWLLLWSLSRPERGAWIAEHPLIGSVAFSAFLFVTLAIPLGVLAGHRLGVILLATGIGFLTGAITFYLAVRRAGARTMRSD